MGDEGPSGILLYVGQTVYGLQGVQQNLTLAVGITKWQPCRRLGRAAGKAGELYLYGVWGVPQDAYAAPQHVSLDMRLVGWVPEVSRQKLKQIQRRQMNIFTM
jgi:hypothetical protein